MGEKKSERLEIRLSHSKKQAFLKACDKNGITSSEAIRLFIDTYIVQSRWKRIKTIAKEMTMIAKRHPAKSTSTAIASALIGLIILAGPSVADEKTFKLYDKDKDGRITHEELSNTRDGSEILVLMDNDESGDITLDEFATNVFVHTVSDRLISGPKRAPKRVIEVLVAEYDFSQGGLAYSTISTSEFVALDTSETEVSAVVDNLKAKNKKYQQNKKHCVSNDPDGKGC